MIEEKKMPATSSLTIRDIIELVFRGKWIIVFFTFLGFLTAGALYLKTPPIYQSEAKLLIRYVSDTTRLEPNSKEGQISTPLRNGETIVNSELEILTSQNLVEKVIQDIGPERFASTSSDPRSVSALAYYVSRSLSVGIQNRSNVIRLSFDAPNPELAQTFLSKLIDHYRQKHLDIHSESGIYDFLARQTDQMRSQLAETEEQLRRLRNLAGIISVEDAKASVAHRLDQLKQEVQETEVYLASAQARLGLMRGSMTVSEGETNVVKTAVEEGNRISAFQLYERLREQKQRESALLAVYTTDSQPVRNLRLQIEETKKLIAGMPFKTQPIADMVGGATNLQSETLFTETDVVSLKAKIKKLRESIDQTQIEAQQIDKSESGILELQRKKEIQEANYRYFAQSLEQARIDNTLNAQNFSNISIIQPATLPGVKSRPKLFKKMALAVVLGFFCGLGIVFFKERMLKRTFNRAEDLETSLQIPVLISIPYIHLLNGSWRNHTGKRRGRSAIRPAIVSDDGDSFAEAPIWNTFQELEDYYELLKYRLLAAARSTPEKSYTMAFTGCFPGSGVTTCAAGLALTLARHGNGKGQVLLVDANFGRPMAQKLLGINPASSLADMLATGNGEAMAVQRNLHFLPAGRLSEETFEKDFALSMANVVQCLKERSYRFILFDTGPVMDTRVALRICHMMDGVILVIDADKTDRAAVVRASRMLEEGDNRMLGVVFNRKRSYTPRWLAMPE